MSSRLRQPRTHGVQDIGESSAQCTVREGEEETGTIAEVTGLLGVYAPPGLVVYDDGEPAMPSTGRRDGWGSLSDLHKPSAFGALHGSGL